MYIKILKKISKVFEVWARNKKTKNYIGQLPSIIEKYANNVEILIIQY